MNKGVLVITFLFTVNITIFSQERISFFGENIDFLIDKEIFGINGVYFFLNNYEKDVENTIFFPFGLYSKEIEIVNVFNLKENKKINYVHGHQGISFKLNIAPKDTVIINISYTQRAEEENTYVLKSTQTWGEPLVFANYTLTVDNSVKLKSLSYKPDKRKKSVYYWYKKDFYPSKDFVVRIR